MIRGRLYLVSLILTALLPFGCAHHAPLATRDYGQFVEARKTAVPTDEVVEIYGHYSAGASGKSVSSTFNLLLQPGNNAYLEIVNPSNQLVYAINLNREQVTLLWARDGNYVQVPSTAANLRAITGIPLPPDDALLLVAGFGLDFPEWQMKSGRKDGWVLTREDFTATISLSENISKIKIRSAHGGEVMVQYRDYRQVDNRSLPADIRFDLPGKKRNFALKIDKYVPRGEPPRPDLFAVKLPDNAVQLDLQKIYRGEPLLLQ